MAVAELVFEQVVSASAVRECLENSSALHVVFRSCHTELTPEDTKEITEVLNPDLNSLTVVDCVWFDDEVLNLISQRCSQLCTVSLTGSLPKLTGTGISSLVSNCADLKSLAILSSESSVSEAEPTNDEAERETKYSKWSLDDGIFDAFLDKPNSSLEYFSLGGFDRITSEGLKKFIEHEKTTLTTLQLSKLHIIDSSSLEQIATSCPSLTTVRLHCCKLTDEGVERLCSKCKLLQSFDLSGCEDLTDRAVISVAKHCSVLENLKIRSCLNVTEGSLGVLATDCLQLKSLDISHCAVSHIPFEFLKLEGLKDLRVDGCEGLKCPPLDIASKGLEEIRNFLEQCDIQLRCRLTFLGCQGSGKSSLISLLPMVSCLFVVDVPTEGIHASMWKPFVKTNAQDLQVDVDESLASLSVEMWDCGGRRCLHGIHPLFLMDNSLYVVVFNIGNPQDIKEVPHWIHMIQAKAPGSGVILVGTHADSDDDNTDLGQKVLQLVQEAEQAQCNEIQVELDALRELKDEPCVKARISRLEVLLTCRPKLPDKVVFVSTLKGKGIGDLQREILQKISDNNVLPHLREKIPTTVTYVFAEILKLRAAKTCVITWDVYVQILSDAGVTSDEKISQMTKMLEIRGCILVFLVPARYQDKGPSKVVCVHPGVLLNCLAKLHCEVDPREYVPNFVKAGMLEKFWPTGAKPNEWTLRSAIDDIVTKGLIRESVIPLCFQVTDLKEEVLSSMVFLFSSLGFLVEGAPKGSYDVELLLAYYKNMSVFKRFYLPLQSKLPKEPPNSVWPRPLPDRHIQVGWRYKFRYPLSADLCALLMGACRNLKKSSEIHGYWQTGMVLQVGSVSVHFSYDNSTLDVIGRCKITHGSKQALNMTWCVLFQFYYVIEVLLGNCKGLCPEIIVPIEGCNRPKHKPLCELIRDYNSQLKHHTNYRWFIPPADLDAEEHTAIPADMLTWLSGIARKATLHISYHGDQQDEVKLLKNSLELAGFDCVGDWSLSAEGDELCEQRRQNVLRASLFIAFVTSQYLGSTRASDDIKLAHSEHNSLIAVLFDKTGWPAQDELGVLLSEHAVCLDLSAGTGTGLSHEYDPKQLTDVINQCNGTLYGTGDIHPPEPPPTPENTSQDCQASQILDESNLDYTAPPLEESRKSLSEDASVFEQVGPNLEDGKIHEEMKRMAASAVAAAVAGAAAQQVSKTNQSSEAIKAAATAAEVAQAVVEGDSEAASRGVARVAQIVEESAKRESRTMTNVPNGVGTAPPKSSTCIVL